MSYRVVKLAIESRQSLTARHGNHLRFFSPHILGKSGEGEDCVVGYQYAGGRPGGLPPAGDWCFFRMKELQRVRPNADNWRIGRLSSRPDGLIVRIEARALPPDDLILPGMPRLVEERRWMT